MAAIQFGGYADDEKIKKYATQLELDLKENGIEYFGNFRFLGYNAPYQVLDRKNEIIVSIQWKEWSDLSFLRLENFSRFAMYCKPHSVISPLPPSPEN